MRFLFVCSANRQRSATAERHFSERNDHEFDSAGTNHKMCDRYGTQKLDEDMLEWADHVFVMEEKHRDIIRKHTDGRYDRKIEVLGIRDVYKYMQPELIEILEEKCGGYFTT